MATGGGGGAIVARRCFPAELGQGFLSLFLPLLLCVRGGGDVCLCCIDLIDAAGGLPACLLALCVLFSVLCALIDVCYHTQVGMGGWM